jgi:hypothetical protein
MAIQPSFYGTINLLKASISIKNKYNRYFPFDIDSCYPYKEKGLNVFPFNVFTDNSESKQEEYNINLIRFIEIANSIVCDNHVRHENYFSDCRIRITFKKGISYEKRR